MVLCAASMHSVAQDEIQRKDLRIADDVVQTIREGIWTSPHPAIGYSPIEMEQYGPDPYIMRSVRLLFNDALTIPRYAGTTSTNLLNASEIAGLFRVGYGMTDVSAGRMLPLPDSAAIIVADDPDRARPLPEHVRRLVARLTAAVDDAEPYYRKAIAGTPITSRLASVAAKDQPDSALALARRLWQDDRLDQMATPDHEAVTLLRTVDRRSMAFASVIFAAHLDRAVREFRSADSATPCMVRGRWTFKHRFGSILVTGVGADTISDADDVFMSIDLGGDDLYLGRIGVAVGPRRPFACVLDVAGNDTYATPDDSLTIGAAVFGVAVLLDMAGNDRYHGGRSSMGAAWFGSAALIDMSGNDDYTLRHTYGQGAGTAGVGILDDRSGNDIYICAAEGQAFAQTYGAGLLIDRAGDDRYTARLDGAPSELYLGQSVSRAQGASFGRRADLGDGHSLSGGMAMLVDAAGDDLYTAAAWSQGCGYWWGAGFLEDHAGNDTYINGKYSLGAGAHFAIGSIVDLRGDDAYNIDNADAVNQYHGHGRDGSIGIAIDGAGNDRYHLRSHCGGSGDLGSIGVFWDRLGDDEYELLYEPTDQAGWADTPPLGTATKYEPFNTYRDDLLTVGVFLDGAGLDAYTWLVDGKEHTAGRTGNSRTSPLIRNPRSRGLFIDR
jgi:hypothetical protein